MWLPCREYTYCLSDYSGYFVAPSFTAIAFPSDSAVAITQSQLEQIYINNRYLDIAASLSQGIGDEFFFVTASDEYLLNGIFTKLQPTHIYIV